MNFRGKKKSIYETLDLKWSEKKSTTLINFRTHDMEIIFQKFWITHTKKIKIKLALDFSSFDVCFGEKSKTAFKFLEEEVFCPKILYPDKH